MSAGGSEGVRDPWSVHVIGLGAQTSVGLTLPTTAAAVRGGINRFTVHDHLRSKTDGAPLTLALQRALPARMSAFERMVALGRAAASQALHPWSSLPRSAPLPVAIAIPARRPGLAEADAVELARRILEGLSIPLDRERCLAVDAGHAGGFAALAHAIDQLQDDEAEAFLVGGVDSYADIDTLDWLDAAERLKTERTPLGFIPGEGAAFALVARGDLLRAAALRSMTEIVGVASTLEPRPWYLGRPTLGAGLTEALSGLLLPDPGAPRRADTTYADLNGESWRADEWTYAYLRTGEQHGHPLRLVHPADAWGDVGAASGPLLLAMACLDLRCGRAGRSAVVWTASDTQPYRSACLLEATEE